VLILLLIFLNTKRPHHYHPFWIGEGGRTAKPSE
jgi:hypothetical protein